MLRMTLLAAVLLAAIGLTGCGSSGPPPVKVVPQSGVERAKVVLQSYANGQQQLGSEVMAFPEIVEDVRKSDPAKADLLQKGLDDLQRSPPASRPAKAKALLGKL